MIRAPATGAKAKLCAVLLRELVLLAVIERRQDTDPSSHMVKTVPAAQSDHPKILLITGEVTFVFLSHPEGLAVFPMHKFPASKRVGSSPCSAAQVADIIGSPFPIPAVVIQSCMLPMSLLFVVAHANIPLATTRPAPEAVVVLLP